MQATIAIRWVGEGALTTRTEDELTERFLRLARHELNRAYRLAGLLLADRTEAEDAVQDALVRAWHRRVTLRDPADFAAWFDRILVNGCRDRLRRRSRVRFVELDVARQAEVRDPFRAFLDRDEATRALAVLDPDQRVVVILHYWADLTLTGVAQRTGWPLGTVKSRLHHALRRLEAELGGAAEAETGQ
jgi:RNA polymerase sigma-70 factor (ECF subfamily)